MYNAHFNFPESPFGVTPDPHFYYSNTFYREAWATLRYGIQGRKGFVVISGEPGTGKTTLLRKALHELPANIKTAYIADALATFSELLRLVLKELRLNPAENKYDQMEQLNQYLLREFSAGNIVALLIDEAQDLSLECLEELRLLGNLETDKHKLLQIVLVGQPGLEKKLNDPQLVQLKQRVALRCRLRPIAPAEIASYIESRLQTIGRRSKDIFDAECIDKIAFYSKGFPRQINILCDNALLTAYAMSKFKIDAAIIDEVAADIFIGESRIGAEPYVGTLIGLPEENRSTQHIEKIRPAKRYDLDAVFGKFSIRQPIPLVGGVLVTILLVVVGISGGFRYAQKFNSPSNAAVPIGGRDAMDRSELALFAPALKTVSDSNQNASAEDPGEIPNAPSSRNKVRVRESPTTLTENKKSETARREGKLKSALSRGTFFVIEPSLVRSKPTSNAEIVATLQSGTLINVTDRTGDYYRISSLGRTETIRGYVHEQDAFFERH